MLTNVSISKQADSRYRWVMLILAALTPLCAVTLPNMSLPPLFATIRADLGLSLVEMGVVWGTISFTGIFFALIGGTLGDRFGTRTMLVAACLLTGVFGITRGLAVDFPTLMITMLAYGVFQAVLPVLIFKVARQWFPPQQLGMASGVISAGFAGGLMLGPLISTSVLLPALGGWRQIMLFYGVIALLLGFLWWLVHPAQSSSESEADLTPRVSLGASLSHIMRLRSLWILGLGGMGVNACLQGFSGYLPTYLKAVGWAELDADRALSAFFLTSLIAVVPLSTLSDRLRLRRGFLIFAALVLSVGIGLLSVVEGVLVVLVLAATGFVFDSFMAILSASVLEADGVSHVYAGTALGFSTMIRNLGGAFSPAVGNSLAVIGLNVPFLFWSGMSLFAVFMFAFVLKPRKPRVIEREMPEPVLSGQ